MMTTEERLAEMHTDIAWIKEAIKCMDSTYAKKWTEKLAVGLVSTILVAVAGALLGLILVPQVIALAHLYINLLT